MEESNRIQRSNVAGEPSTLDDRRLMALDTSFDKRPLVETAVVRRGLVPEDEVDDNAANGSIFAARGVP